MATEQIFVNLPVKDLERSKAFFSALGYRFNPEFSDDKAACMIVSEGHSYVMLLVESFFQTFTTKQLTDTSTSTEVEISVSRPSRAAVDDTVAKAIAAGGKAHGEPVDYGFMYQHGFEDPDGHTWGLAYMSAMPPGASQ